MRLAQSRGLVGGQEGERQGVKEEVNARCLAGAPSQGCHIHANEIGLYSVCTLNGFYAGKQVGSGKLVLI